MNLAKKTKIISRQYNVIYRHELELAQVLIYISNIILVFTLGDPNVHLASSNGKLFDSRLRTLVYKVYGV